MKRLIVLLMSLSYNTLATTLLHNQGGKEWYAFTPYDTISFQPLGEGGLLVTKELLVGHNQSIEWDYLTGHMTERFLMSTSEYECPLDSIKFVPKILRVMAIGVTDTIEDPSDLFFCELKAKTLVNPNDLSSISYMAVGAKFRRYLNEYYSQRDNINGLFSEGFNDSLGEVIYEKEFKSGDEMYYDRDHSYTTKVNRKNKTLFKYHLDTVWKYRTSSKKKLVYRSYLDEFGDCIVDSTINAFKGRPGLDSRCRTSPADSSAYADIGSPTSLIETIQEEYADRIPERRIKVICKPSHLQKYNSSWTENLFIAKNGQWYDTTGTKANYLCIYKETVDSAAVSDTIDSSSMALCVSLGGLSSWFRGIVPPEEPCRAVVQLD